MTELASDLVPTKGIVTNYTESLWEEYKEVWRMAERVVPVAYTDSLESYTGGSIAGAYYAREGIIYVQNKEFSGRLAPEPMTDARMARHACIILHELNHAISHSQGGQRYDDYMRALRLWNIVNMDGTLLTDRERILIYDEETRVDLGGFKMSGQFSKAIRDEYVREMVTNLANYHSLLWTGYWTNGIRQRWEGSEMFNKMMDFLDREKLTPAEQAAKATLEKYRK